MTATGIVVVMHSCNSAWTGDCPFGADLDAECAAFSTYAALYINNPYVWFETSNEPNDQSNNSSLRAPAGSVTAEHLAVYNAVRNTGNQNIVVCCGATFATLNPSNYSSMTNMVWDWHYYGWTEPWWRSVLE